MDFARLEQAASRQAWSSPCCQRLPRLSPLAVARRVPVAAALAAATVGALAQGFRALLPRHSKTLLRKPKGALNSKLREQNEPIALR